MTPKTHRVDTAKIAIELSNPGVQIDPRTVILNKLESLRRMHESKKDQTGIVAKHTTRRTSLFGAVLIVILRDAEHTDEEREILNRSMERIAHPDWIQISSQYPQGPPQSIPMNCLIFITKTCNHLKLLAASGKAPKASSEVSQEALDYYEWFAGLVMDRNLPRDERNDAIKREWKEIQPDEERVAVETLALLCKILLQSEIEARELREAKKLVQKSAMTPFIATDARDLLNNAFIQLNQRTWTGPRT